MKHKGECHCRKVKFQTDLDPILIMNRWQASYPVRENSALLRSSQSMKLWFCQQQCVDNSSQKWGG